MAKFTAQEKIHAVKRYLEGVEGHRTIAISVGVNASLFRTWIKQFQYSGEQAFEKRYTNYSLEFKLNVLNYMNEQGMSPNEVAGFFNIPSPGTVRKWRSLIETGGIDALQSKKKGRAPMKKGNRKGTKPVEGSVEELQAEVDHLRMENAYLKKLNALVQNKEKSPNKTKRK